MAVNGVPLVLSTGFLELQDVDAFFRGANLKKGQLLLQAGHVYDVSEAVLAAGSEIVGKCIPQTRINAATKRVTLEVSLVSSKALYKCSKQM